MTERPPPASRSAESKRRRLIGELSRQLTTGIVAIDGPSGAGKSMFADDLMAALAERGSPALLVRTDHFATWDNPVGWWPEMEDHVLRPFARGQEIGYRPIEWVRGAPVLGSPWVRRRQPLLVIEGVSSARRQISDRITCALWLDGGSAQERLERAVARDGEGTREHLERWQAFERGWFAVDDTRARCRVVG